MTRRYRISVMSDASSWLNAYLPRLVRALQKRKHQVRWVHDLKSIRKGDISFYLSCSKIVPPETLALNRHNLIVHESALPRGKGWSPLTWQILEGKKTVPITLFEAADKVDSGMIYLKDTLRFKGTELVEELRQAQALKTVALCLRFIDHYPKTLIKGLFQMGKSTYYSRRRPDDSRLDPRKSLLSQFNLLRVVDNERYPAYFDFRGIRYLLKIEKDKRPS